MRASILRVVTWITFLTFGYKRFICEVEWGISVVGKMDVGQWGTDSIVRLRGEFFGSNISLGYVALGYLGCVSNYQIEWVRCSS